jgi:hypothetical protein
MIFITVNKIGKQKNETYIKKNSLMEPVSFPFPVGGQHSARGREMLLHYIARINSITVVIVIVIIISSSSMIITIVVVAGHEW